MCKRVLDETTADDEIYMLAWVDVELMALVMFEFDPAPINKPPFMVKVPLKSTASSTPLSGPLAITVPPDISTFPLLSIASPLVQLAIRDRKSTRLNSSH